MGQPRSAQRTTAATVTRRTRATPSPTRPARRLHAGPRPAARPRARARPRHGRRLRLRGSEVRALATVGAFRVVPADDLRDDRGRAGDVRHGDLERLREAGLIRTVAPLDRGERTTLVTLTERGRDVLESHRSREPRRRPDLLRRRRSRAASSSHDAQLYRAYLRAAERLRARWRAHPARRPRLRAQARVPAVPAGAQRGRSDSDGRPDSNARRDPGMGARARPAGRQRPRAVSRFPDRVRAPDGRRDVEDVEVTTRPLPRRARRRQSRRPGSPDSAASAPASAAGRAATRSARRSIRTPPRSSCDDVGRARRPGAAARLHRPPGGVPGDRDAARGRLSAAPLLQRSPASPTAGRSCDFFRVARDPRLRDSAPLRRTTGRGCTTSTTSRSTAPSASRTTGIGGRRRCRARSNG